MWLALGLPANVLVKHCHGFLRARGHADAAARDAQGTAFALLLAVLSVMFGAAALPRDWLGHGHGFTLIAGRRPSGFD